MYIDLGCALARAYNDAVAQDLKECAHPEKYTGVSWVLLRWHQLFMLLGLSEVSGLNWALSITFLVITARLLLFRFFLQQVHYQRNVQAMQPQLQGAQSYGFLYPLGAVLESGVLLGKSETWDLGVRFEGGLQLLHGFLFVGYAL